MAKSVSVAVTAVLALAELLAGAVADEVADGVAGVGLELLLPLEPHPARVSAAAITVIPAAAPDRVRGAMAVPFLDVA
jgi:hypothetical protein